MNDIISHVYGGYFNRNCILWIIWELIENYLRAIWELLEIFLRVAFNVVQSYLFFESH
jgi:hypothetical protein